MRQATLLAKSDRRSRLKVWALIPAVARRPQGTGACSAIATTKAARRLCLQAGGCTLRKGTPYLVKRLRFPLSKEGDCDFRKPREAVEAEIPAHSKRWTASSILDCVDTI